MMRIQQFGRQLGAFALLALLVRALVPSGYMLAEAEGAGGRYLVVQMCDGHAAAPLVVDLDTGKLVDKTSAPGKPGGKTADTPCAFAVSPHMASPPVATTLVAFVQARDAEIVVSAALSPGRGIAAPPPPSTGPPHLI